MENANVNGTYRPPSEIVTSNSAEIVSYDTNLVPALFAQAGDQATYKFIEFFTANIRNPNTRAAYFRAVHRFSTWCENHGFELTTLEPIRIAAYVEELDNHYAAPSIKQHLAAIRMLFDFLVVSHVITVNPAAAVKGPKHVVKVGKTPVLTVEEMRELFDAIDVSKMSGLRDRAIIGVMVYSFARIGAVLAMNVEDYFQQGKRWFLRLHEKGGKLHQVPVHHKAEKYLDEYLDVAGIKDNKKSPLFRTLDNHGQLTEVRLPRRQALKMVKRRAKKTGLGDDISNHTFRATGITAYLKNGGTVENAQRIAAHESPRTTKLYDRTSDEINLGEVEKINI